jgi:uncharacterized protein YacL
MRNLIRKALTRTVVRRIGRGGKKLERVELLPSERLVYGLYFAFLGLIMLTVIESLYIVFLHSFSNEIFSCITTIIGTILGVFISHGS